MLTTQTPCRLSELYYTIAASHHDALMLPGVHAVHQGLPLYHLQVIPGLLEEVPYSLCAGLMLVRPELLPCFPLHVPITAHKS